MVFTEGYAANRALPFVLQQTIRANIELILVTGDAEPFTPNSDDLALFGSYQILRLREIVFPGQGFAAGVRAANAPIIAYCEEHSYPEPEWAEALVRAHVGPYAAVGAAMGNGNPDSLCSWLGLYQEFGPVVTPVVSGVATYLGGHHTSYKRDVLLTYGDRLENMLENETALHIDLRARGHTLYLTGDAVSNHVNISQPLAMLRQGFLGQRSFAAARAQAGSWSLSKRALYVLAAPLIPFVRLVRIVREMERTHRAAQFLPRGLPLLWLFLVWGTVGECVGYLVGDSPETVRERARAELARSRFLAEQTTL